MMKSARKKTSNTPAGSFRFRGWTRLVTAAAVAALGLVTIAAEQQAGQDVRASQTGTVDFVVVTRDGRPVTDLKADEVTLRIDGKVRPIKTLQFVRVSAAAGPMDDAAPAGPSVPPAFATNLAAVAAAPRSIVLVVDDESMPIGQEQKLRSALTSFVNDLPAEDQVALVTVPHGGIKLGLTTDRDRMRRAIAEISPISPIENATCRTRTTLSTLEATVGQLMHTTNQPVTVAFLSAALTGQSQMEAAPDPRGGQALSAQAGGCYLRTDDFVRVGNAVAAAHAQLYVIHPDFSNDPVREGVENLRGQTGAPLFHLSAGTEPGLYRMARETSAYYVATFDVLPDELTGKPHPSSVRTTRKDVELRDRPYVIVGRAASAPTTTTTVTTAFEMVRSGKQYRDLPLRATASPSKNPDGTINVIGLFEPLDPNTKIMTAAAALIDEAGKGIAYWQGDADKMTSWPTAVGLTVKPGTYRMRIAAIDAGGRLGLVDDTVVAELQQAGSLQVGGLVLGLSRAEGFTPRLQFTTEATAIAYVEIYGGTEGTQVGVQFEVAQTTDGPALMRRNGVLAATNEDGKFTAQAVIPIGAFTPGDYVIRAIVGVPNQPATRVLRTLHKAG